MSERAILAATLIWILLVLPATGSAGADLLPGTNGAQAQRQVEEALEEFRAADNGRAEDAALDAAKIARERSDDPAAEAARELVTGEGRASGPDAARDLEKRTPEKYALVISSSIPIATLRTYAAQTESMREKGREVELVLRGFVGGMKRIGPTIAFYTDMAATVPGAGLEAGDLRALALLIDPGRTKGIPVVPALMNEAGCVVYGDAPLPFLMEKLAGGACGETFGATFEPVEPDALEEVRAAAERVDLASYSRQPETRLAEQTDVLPGEGLLPPAARDSVRTIVPEYELPFDVRDPETGRILYPKGFRYTPLEYAPPLPFEIAVVNGERRTEIAWLVAAFETGLLRETSTVSALGGEYRSLTEALGRPVFSGVELTRLGWCTATPCIVTRKGGELKVREFFVPEEPNAAR